MNNSRTTETSFARDLGLFDATMIGVGAMIGAGIFVLTGIAAGQAGPASILAFALNGAVTLLTAFAYAELASAIPRAGGGYSFVRLAYPGVVGYLAGWMLWFAYTVACSLYALGFASYFWEFFLKYVPGVTGGVYGIVGQHWAILTVTLLIGLFFYWTERPGGGGDGQNRERPCARQALNPGDFHFFRDSSSLPGAGAGGFRFHPLPSGGSERGVGGYGTDLHRLRGLRFDRYRK